MLKRNRNIFDLNSWKSLYSDKLKKLWSDLSKADLWLIISFGIILLLGLLVLSSASSVFSFQKYGDSYFLFKKQAAIALIGLIAFVVASKIDYRIWQKYAVHMLGISIVLLVAVFLPGIGVEYKGSNSWINLGFTNIQPTEIVKFTLLVYFSAWLVSRRDQLQNFDINVFAGPMAAIILIAGLIVMEPDTGTLGVIAFMLLGVYFLSNAPLKHILALVGAGGFLLVVLVLVAPYRLKRIMAFLNPENDPLGIGYHILQAKLAIGSGGWIGLGVGKSRQKFNYLPEVFGDSIFAVMAEEIGFIFSMLFIGLLLFALWRCYLVIKFAPDDFSRLIAAGITIWFFVQIFFNIGGVLGVMPMTGVTLPLVSYGGTSIVINLFVIGVLVNISKHIKSRS